MAAIKDLKPGKWVRIDGRGKAEQAQAETAASIDRYGSEPLKLAN